MKIQSLLLFLILSFLSSEIYAQGQLTVTVNGIEAAGVGKLTMMLFDSEEGFGKKLAGAAYREDVSDFGTSATHTFKDLPPGTYAIMVFQDQNENGDLDKNWVGFPKEPLAAYGMKGFGRPTFAKSSVVLADAPLSVALELFNQ